MSFLERVKNLWKLSEYQPGVPTDEYKIPGSVISSLVKKPEQKKVEQARFIPRVAKDPIKELVNESL